MVSMPDIADHQIWMVVVGFIIAFALAFGIGANDVANSFGTSVGAKVLTMRQACILASIFETLGAILLGAKVSDTIRKGIIDIEPYRNDTDLLMVGNVAALSGSCVWLIAATLLRMPVSATHSIVGATVGFALVAHGSRGINWTKLGMIIGSWFISPVAAGFVSTLLFCVCRYFILSKEDPLEPGLKFLPIFYATTVVVNLFSVFYDGPEMLGFDKIPLWGTFILSFGVGIIVAIVVRFAIVPWQRKKIKDHCANATEQAKAIAEQEDDDAFDPPSKQYTYQGKDGGGDKHEKQPLNLTVMQPGQDGDDISEDGRTTKCTPIGASNIMPPTASIFASRDLDIASVQKSLLAISEQMFKEGRILTEITYPHGEKRRMSWGRRSSESERQRRTSESDRSKRRHSECERPRYHSESEAIKTERVRHKSEGARLRSQSECDHGELSSIVETKESKENEKNLKTQPTIPEVNGPPTGAPPANKAPGIDKAEDAPLMDNEYKLGSSTPITFGTQEDVSLQKQNGMNKPTVTIATPNNNVSAAEKGEPSDLEAGRSAVVDRQETAQLFSFLQILTAVFGSFAHGGNDVSNAIGPVVSLWLTATTASVAAKASTPIWILLYGGVGISIGLWIWGRRVIKTLGEDLTKITPSSGFCIEIGSALTVLVASNIGIPISTTHCKVGSVVFVGRFRARENVDWSIFRNIVLAWLVTLPVCGGISAAIMAGLKLAV